MSRRRLAAHAFACSLLSTWALPAAAAGDCPDGDWFCDRTPLPPDQPGPPPGPSTPPGRQPPPPGATPGQPPSRDVAAPPEQPPPFYPPPPPGAEDEMVMEVPPPPPRVHRRRGYREWGFNMHALIGIMGSDRARSPDADMGGLGLALRYRPFPHLAIEGAAELAWGTDYNGISRFEDAFAANSLLFFNPFSSVQLYALAGLNLGNAYLDGGVDAAGRPLLADEQYRYFGGQLGIGVEARITRHLGLGLDWVGFLRGRIDAHASRNPEFFEPSTGRRTNTSAGSFVRFGATFYW